MLTRGKVSNIQQKVTKTSVANSSGENSNRFVTIAFEQALEMCQQYITRIATNAFRQETDAEKKREITKHYINDFVDEKKPMVEGYKDLFALKDALIDEIANNDKIVKYIDIPMQHTEDRVLKLMNRKGTRAGYLQLIQKLREKIPEIAVRSTFISGFPTETESEFLGMQAFVREAKLLNCGFFAYSKEPDTPAYRLKGHIHHATKTRRVKALYETQQAVSAEILQSFVGKTIDVLCDGIDYEKGCFVGRAYFNAPDIDGKIYFNANEAMQGKRYAVRVDSADAYDLYGKTEDFEL